MARSPRAVVDEPSRIDRLFGLATTASGLLVLVLLALVGYFLFLRAGDAFDVAGWSFFTTAEWRTDIDPPEIGVLGLACGTVLVAVIAVVLAVPLGTCAALFITDYASGRWRSLLTALVDLLAAIPSLLYGVWGFFVLAVPDRPAVRVDQPSPRLDPDLPHRGGRRAHGVDAHRRHRSCR